MKILANCWAVIIGVFVLHLPVNTQAQDQSTADSLLTIYESLSEDDTSGLRVLTQIVINLNDPNARIFYAEKLMDIAEKEDNNFYLHQAYLYHGQASRLKGDFDIAIYSLFKSLDFAILANYKKGAADVYTALADTYSSIGNHQMAGTYYHKGIKVIGPNDSSLLANLLLNLGDEYFQTGVLDSALIYFDQSRIIYDALGGNQSGIAYALGNAGLVYAELGATDLAEQNLRKAFSVFRELKDYYAIAVFLNYMSESYQRNGLLKEAQVYADSSIQIARKYGFKTEISDNILRLADIYASKSDFQQAYKFQKAYDSLKDSLTNEQILTTIANLESSFELSRKRAEIDLLTAEKKNQQLIIIGAIIFALVITFLAVIIFGLYRNKNRINKILETQKKELQSLNETKDKFFSIISHDLRGPINAFHGVSRIIKHAVESHQSDQLMELAEHVDSSVDSLSSLLDNLLTWAIKRQGEFPIQPENIHLLEVCEEILDTFKNMARSKSIRLDLKMDENLYLWADLNTLRTILRNLISNALKFTPEQGLVTLTAERIGSKVQIEVQDSGQGIAHEKLKTLFQLQAKKSTFGTAGEKGLGIGLQLVYEFVEANNGIIEVESTPEQGTLFRVYLPLFPS